MAYLSQTFRRAEAIRRQAKKAAEKWSVGHCESYDDMKKNMDEFYEREIKSAVHEFKEVLKIQLVLNEIYDEMMGDVDSGKQWFFLSIRPVTDKIDFCHFYEKIQSILERQCFIEYTLSFEQKGTTDETLGTGFHAHIVAQMTQTSKGQVLRDMKSSFKKWIQMGIISAEGIDVVVAKRPKELIQDYLIDYKVKKDYKIETKAWDAKWREQIGLLPIYKGDLPTLTVNKPTTVRVVPDSRVREKPQTVTFD